jgi:hypothetical protein
MIMAIQAETTVQDHLESPKNEMESTGSAQISTESMDSRGTRSRTTSSTNSTDIAPLVDTAMGPPERREPDDNNLEAGGLDQPSVEEGQVSMGPGANGASTTQTGPKVVQTAFIHKLYK